MSAAGESTVREIHRESNDGKEEIDLFVPCFSVLVEMSFTSTCSVCDATRSVEVVGARFVVEVKVGDAVAVGRRSG